MGQKIGLDTPVLIYLLQRNPTYIDRVREVMREVQSGSTVAIFSAIGLIEILTGPKKQGRHDLAAQYRETLFNFPNLTVRGLNQRIIEYASDLRASYNISTPDAIHLATAIDSGVSKFITNDRSLKKIREIKVELL